MTRSNQPYARRNVNHTPVTFTITARPEVKFDFASTPAIHHADNPYLSHFWNALSIMAPGPGLPYWRTQVRVSLAQIAGVHG